MSTGTTGSGSGPNPVVRNLRTVLATGLPGLTDDQLDDLADRTHDELCERVGAALTEDVSTDQLEKFAAMLDGGADDDEFQAWLKTNAPGSKVIVACVRANLLAEVIHTVTDADPRSVNGERLAAELVAVRLEIIESWLSDEELQYTREGHRLTIGLEKHGSPLSALIDIRLPDTADRLLTLTARPHGLDFTDLTESQLESLAATWNGATSLPKAVVRDDETGHRIDGEIAIPYPAWSTREQVLVPIARSIDEFFSLFEKLRAAIAPEDAHPAGRSVITT